MAKKNKGKNDLWHSLHESRRGTHKPEVSGSIPLSSTILDDLSKIASLRSQY